MATLLADFERNPSTSRVSVCRFCQVFSSDAPTEEIFDVGNAISAVASVGALVPGWTLVIPNEHALSLATLPSQRRIEVMEAVETVRRDISSYFRKPAFVFEHGPSSQDSDVSCTTAHVHIHVVPIEGDVFRSAARNFPIESAWQAATLYSLGELEGLDYLLASSGPDDLRLAALRMGISQYFRRVIALMIDRPGCWHWNEFPNEAQQLATTSALRALYSH
jgi:diadenosine tetraphosphate (Ap4A) HIT family hydrolase